MRLQFLILSLFLCTAGLSQDFILKRQLADRYYDHFDFYKAIPMYEQLLKSHPNDYVLYERLATIYDHINDSQNAERCYAVLVQNKKATPSEILNYGRALARNGKYVQAIQCYQKYREVRPGDPRGAAFAEAWQNMASFYKDSASFTLKKAPFSTKANEFSPAYYGGSIVFSSDQSRFSMTRNLYNWTLSPFFDLYIASPNSAEAKPFSKDLNTTYHEGPLCFNKQQDTIIFTRSLYVHSHLHKSNEGINRMGLFQAVWNKGEKRWVNVKPLTINNDEYSVEHPALSPDGSKLYFASDMPGGMGGLDLYVSHRITDAAGEKSWGVPVNLGPAINSPGNDQFPFIDGVGNLWYASDGIPGLGGLDIFFAAKSAEGFSKCINPGYPMNTRFDDFGYITDSEGENGYLSSDRNNTYGNDDIYSIQRPFRKHLLWVYDTKTRQGLPGAKIEVKEGDNEPRTIDNANSGPALLSVNPYKDYQFEAKKALYKPTGIEFTSNQLKEMDTIKIPMDPMGAIRLNGFVFAANNKSPLPNCTVVLQNETNGMGLNLRTDDQGMFSRQLTASSDYKVSIRTVAGKCSVSEIAVTTKGISKDTTINLSVPVYCEGDVIQVENIYYDLNKYNIRPDAARSLDKLLKVMKDYPGMKIELRSHTDSRGSAASNMTLSNNRAKAAAEYLYSKGIARNRIIGKGYGETMLINKCAKGVPCSEAEHQLNRRTEFKILKME